MAAHEAHDLGVVAISNGGRTSVVRTSARRSGSASRGRGDELAHLRLHELRALARHGAALELHEAALGVARQLLPALDQRGVQRAGAEQRVAGAGGELPAEILDAGQHAAALGDRIDAELRLRAVRGMARDLDLEPGEALVRDAHLERRRLGHDRGVGAHSCSATAWVPMLANSSSQTADDGHVARQLEPGGLGAGPQRRGGAALHVEAAAAVEAVALDARLERALVAVVADRVGVPVEQQRAPAAAAARDADHVRAPGRDLLDAHLDARAPRARRR